MPSSTRTWRTCHHWVIGCDCRSVVPSVDACIAEGCLDHAAALMARVPHALLRVRWLVELGHWVEVAQVVNGDVPVDDRGDVVAYVLQHSGAAEQRHVQSIMHDNGLAPAPTT